MSTPTTPSQPVRIAARKSDLARLQAFEVGNRLCAANPGLQVQYLFRESLGDKNLQDPLWKSPTQGVFTEDFLGDLIDGRCDLVVHSWKDLPTEPRAKTEVIATLERADSRDLLLVKKDTWNLKLNEFRIFTSSPRRAYNLKPFLSWALPRHGLQITFESVRGNVQTRVRKLLGDANVSALVVAKAALDRLMASSEPEFEETREFLKASLKQCLIMVLPLSANPAAAAQGALAIEIRKGDETLKNLIAPINDPETFAAVTAERDILRAHGGGCHQKIGIHVHHQGAGVFKSLRGLTDRGQVLDEVSLTGARLPTQYSDVESFPQNNESVSFFEREFIDLERPASSNAFWVARADALPDAWPLLDDDVIWVSGLESWRKLAGRGVWVNGTAESLGESFGMHLEQVLGARKFIKLTHATSSDILTRHAVTCALPVLATYRLIAGHNLPNLSRRKNFFWMSASSFLRALEEYPDLAKSGQHSAGPGNTSGVVKSLLAAAGNNNFFSFLGLRDWRKKTIREA